jgi:hypothetical protein
VRPRLQGVKDLVNGMSAPSILPKLPRRNSKSLAPTVRVLAWREAQFPTPRNPLRTLCLT